MMKRRCGTGKTNSVVFLVPEEKKILIQNIYHMLAYVFKVLKQTNFKEVATEEFDNIHDLFAAILAKGISWQLKQGLYREYIPVQEDFPGLKGKLQIPGTIKNKLRQQQLLSCEYDDLSENNIYNLILKTTAFLLYRHPTLRKECHEGLGRVLHFLPGISEINPSDINWSTLRFQKNNQNYRMLLNMCFYVLNSLLLTTSPGKYKMASFLDEQAMHNLYEKFVLEYYRLHYPSLKANPSTVDWALDDESKKQFLPAMQTDVTLRNNSKTLIIDTKYYSRTMQYRKDFDHYSLHSGNLYQIFSYVKNMDKDCTGDVAGLLLYARTNEIIAPDHDFLMSGNKISVKTLDLNTSFSNIRAQLDEIVSSYFGESIQRVA